MVCVTNPQPETPSFEPQPFRYSQEVPERLEAIHMPKGIAAGFSERYLGAYATGIAAFDSALGTQLATGAIDTCNALTQATNKLYGIASPAPVSTKGAMLDSQGKAREFIKPDDPRFRIMLDALASQAQTGLVDASIQPFLHAAERVTYHEQAPQEAHKGVLIMSDAHAQALGLPEGSSCSAETIHEVLKNEGVIDLSRQALNRRFETFEKTAQIGILELMANSFSQVLSVNNRLRNQSAYTFLALLNLGKPNDLNSRLQILKRVSDELHSDAQKEDDPHAKNLLGLISVRAALIGLETQNRIGFFTSVYDELGYKYPMSGMGTHRIRAKVPQKTPEQIEQERKAAEELRAHQLNELEAIAPQIGVQAEQLDRRWLLTSKEFKAGNFGDIRYALIGEAEKYKLGHEAAFTKDQARHIIDILAKLQKQLSTHEPSAITDKITSDCIAEQSLRTSIRHLNEQLHVVKSDQERLTEPRPLTAYFAKLQDNWPEYRTIITATWPQNGPGFAEQLDVLFAPAPVKPAPEATSATQPQTQQEHFAQPTAEATLPQPETLPVLDIVALPAKPKDIEVKTELRRLGVTARDLTPEKVARFQDFHELTEIFDCTLHISQAGPKTSQRRYYILEFTYDGKKYTVAESVALDRGTYVFAEHLSPGTGRELLDMYKDEARELGALRVNHENDGKKHHEKVLDAILEMHEQEL